MGKQEERTTNQYSDIVNLYSGRVYNLALRMLGNREDTEEATQDVFIRVFRSMESFRGDSNLSTWIWRITTNLCITRSKKKKADAVSMDKAGIDPPDGRINGIPRQEKSLYDRELSDLINKYISRLPETEAATITLFYMEGLSYSEISNVLQLPVGTVSVALHRGRKRLGELLKERRDGL